MTVRIPIVPLTLALLCATATAAAAHEFWLTPSAYRAAAGDTVRFAVHVGTGFRGELKPWSPARALRWTARTRAVEDLRPTARNGDDVFGTFVARDGGGIMAAYESNFVSTELPAAEFDAYLALEGLDGPRTARARSRTAMPGRERYARCPKTWIAGSDPQRATTPAGLTLELVPRGDPTRPGPVELQLLYRGEPLAGALVRAWMHPLAADHRPADATTRDSTGAVAGARTDSRGIVRLAAGAGGEWLVSAVHMVPSRDPRNTEWESYWASLTFERPAGRRTPATGRRR